MYLSFSLFVGSVLTAGPVKCVTRIDSFFSRFTTHIAYISILCFLQRHIIWEGYDRD